MYSINEFIGDGEEDTYTLSFQGDHPGYLSEDHIKVYFDDALQDTDAYTIEDSSKVILDPVPDALTIIKIKRVTPVTPLVDYSSGAVLSELNLDKANVQLLYLVQELMDRVEELENA